MRGGANLVGVRDYNQRVVLEVIREGGGATRAEIAQRTGLSVQTVSNIVVRLLDGGLLKEVAKERSSGKKPRVRLQLDGAAGYALGVQIDKDETMLVLMDLAGRVVSRDRWRTLQEEGPAAVIERVARSTGRMVGESGIDEAGVLGMGVASPGPLDHESGVVLETPHLPGWHEVRLKETLERETGHSVVVDRDATAAAIGERWVGGARGARSFAFVHMGAGGIGAGFFLDDRVYRGAATIAGAIGHTTLNPDGPRCFCGNRGCAELYCGPQAVVRAVEEGLWRGETSILKDPFEEDAASLDFVAIRRAALEGDALAMQELRRSAWLLGCAVVNMVNTVDVELVVLGGKAFWGVGDIYQREVEQVLEERMVAGRWRRVPVELSTAGEDAPAVGAASLILHSAYYPRMTTLKGA